MTNLVCSIEGCGATITKQSKTGMCRPCCCRRTARDPERRRKCSEAMARKVVEPGFLERHGERMKQAFAEARVRDPDFTAKKRAAAQRNRLAEKGTHSPKQAAGSEGRMRAGYKTRERHMGWCPPEYRAEYHHLLHAKKIKRAQAQGIIKDQIKRDAEAYLRTGQLQRG